MRAYQQKRNGFAMIMAIFFMILIATLLSYMLSTTSETAKRTTNVYLNEQAQLLAKSAVEYAILRVSGQDRSGGTCVNSFNAQYPEGTPMFDINVSIQYIGFGGLSGCNNYIGTIATPESNGTMLIDVYVSDNASLNLSEPISYHRRTLQKL
ncbi:type II secretion system protein [Sulfurovum sp.]|uniref:type II secretion system protein n=1 Tax=Sulfurovum sp. TaxID=1969726 RepID=UPI003561A1C2